MNKSAKAMCCALGGGLIGLFANRLNTASGCSMFLLGVILLTSSIVSITYQDKSDK